MKQRHRRSARGCLLALAASALALPAAGFQPLVTDDTGTQGAGGNQLEFSLDAERTREAGVTTQVRTFPVTYTRGLTDTLDLFAGVGHVRIRSSAPGVNASGAGNPVLGAKWRFFESEATKTSLALKPEVLLPVSGAREARGLGNGRTSWGLTLIATQEVGFGALHANLGTGQNHYRDPAAARSTVVAFPIAPVWDIASGWKVALDVGHESEKAGGVTTRSRHAELGAVYSPGEDLDIALGIIRITPRTDPGAATNAATMGVTWRFR